MNYLGAFQWARTNIWLVCNVVFFWLSSAYGYESNAHLLFIISILITFFNNNHQKNWLLWLQISIPVTCLIVLFWTNFSLFTVPNISADVIHKLGIFLFFLTLLGSALGLFFFRNQVVAHAKFLASSEAHVQQKYEELKKTNKELDRFVYSVSHDLRSPITSMMGLLDLMRSDEKGRANYLDLQEKSLKKLDSFISDILTYSRNTRLEVELKPIQLPQLVSNCFLANKPYDNDEIQLVLEVPENLFFLSDEYRLNIIFNNLISNAIRYRRRNISQPFIKVEATLQKEKMVIKVSDNGIGIEEKYQDRIFEMFFRAHTKEVGSGLGLYIVREAMEKLNGKIRVESKVNEGTTFTIELPLHSARTFLPKESLEKAILQ
ncbi:MAG: sensor histidine kinase [Bacteroidia bacterium]